MSGGEGKGLTKEKEITNSVPRPQKKWVLRAQSMVMVIPVKKKAKQK